MGKEGEGRKVLFSIYQDGLLSTHFLVPAQVWVCIQDQRSRGYMPSAHLCGSALAQPMSSCSREHNVKKQIKPHCERETAK